MPHIGYNEKIFYLLWTPNWCEDGKIGTFHTIILEFCLYGNLIQSYTPRYMGKDLFPIESIRFRSLESLLIFI